MLDRACCCVTVSVSIGSMTFGFRSAFPLLVIEAQPALDEGGSRKGRRLAKGGSPKSRIRKMLTVSSVGRPSCGYPLFKVLQFDVLANIL